MFLLEIYCPLVLKEFCMLFMYNAFFDYNINTSLSLFFGLEIFINHCFAKNTTHHSDFMRI